MGLWKITKKINPDPFEDREEDDDDGRSKSSRRAHKKADEVPWATVPLCVQTSKASGECPSLHALTPYGPSGPKLHRMA